MNRLYFVVVTTFPLKRFFFIRRAFQFLLPDRNLFTSKDILKGNWIGQPSKFCVIPDRTVANRLKTCAFFFPLLKSIFVSVSSNESCVVGANEFDGSSLCVFAFDVF